MEQQKRNFKNYRTIKRLEISKMSSLIEAMNDEVNKKEKTLLISSYIVLVYAYWESSFHKFQELMLDSYKSIPIKLLPYNLKNKLLLTLAKKSAGGNAKKVINEVKQMSIFEGIIEFTQKNEELGIEEISRKYHDKISRKDLYKHFILETANPNLERASELLRTYSIKLERIIKEGKESEKIKPYFDKGLDFIIKQRNSIAHKNEKISYRGTEYEEYDLCMKDLVKDIAEGTNTLERPELFINEMTFQIDSFFDIMVDYLEKNIEGLKK